MVFTPTVIATTNGPDRGQARPQRRREPAGDEDQERPGHPCEADEPVEEPAPAHPPGCVVGARDRQRKAGADHEQAEDAGDRGGTPAATGGVDTSVMTLALPFTPSPLTIRCVMPWSFAGRSDHRCSEHREAQRSAKPSSVIEFAKRNARSSHCSGPGHA